MESHKTRGPFFSQCIRPLHPFLNTSQAEHGATIESDDNNNMLRGVNASFDKGLHAYSSAGKTIMGAPPSGIGGNASVQKQLSADISLSTSGNDEAQLMVNA